MTSAEFSWQVYSTVRALQPNAYGVPIHHWLEERMRRSVNVGTMYVTLECLEAEGVLASHWGEATAERGGRRKRMYQTTDKKLLAPDENAAAPSRQMRPEWVRP